MVVFRAVPEVFFTVMAQDLAPVDFLAAALFLVADCLLDVLDDLAARFGVGFLAAPDATASRAIAVRTAVLLADLAFEDFALEEPALAQVAVVWIVLAARERAEADTGISSAIASRSTATPLENFVFRPMHLGSTSVRSTAHKRGGIHLFVEWRPLPALRCLSCSALPGD